MAGSKDLESEISFVIPFRTDNGPRHSIYSWTRDRLEKFFPDSPIVIGETEDEYFNRSEAINDGMDQVETEFVAIVDADTAWNPEIIFESIVQIKSGSNWVIPYAAYGVTTEISGKLILKESSTTRLRVEDYDYDHMLVAHKDEKFPPVSGINILRTEDVFKIGGFDPRFRGWGFEDRAFALAADKIIGKHSRLGHNIFHIWHPVSGTTDHPHFKSNEKLFGQYFRNFESVYKNFLQ